MKEYFHHVKAYRHFNKQFCFELHNARLHFPAIIHVEKSYMASIQTFNDLPLSMSGGHCFDHTAPQGIRHLQCEDSN